MIYYVEFNNDNRIVACALDEMAARLWGVNYEKIDFPDEFDPIDICNWTRVDGRLVRDGLGDKILETQKEAVREEAARRNQIQSAAILFIRSNAVNLTDEEALLVSSLLDEWSPNKVHYHKDDIRQYKDNIYRCISEHDSQESWTPDTAHSLWVRIRPEGEILEWEPVQPGVDEAYKKGDKVTHKGKTWVSTVDANVWEPGVYGWE